jgi:predicted AAA+ superfamily ATPase
MNNYLKIPIANEFNHKLLPNKVLILLVVRRVGKTELINNYLQNIPIGSFLKLNGEDINDASLLKERSVVNYKRLLSKIDVLVIDD